jgi:hypothetical protein
VDTEPHEHWEQSNVTQVHDAKKRDVRALTIDIGESMPSEAEDNAGLAVYCVMMCAGPLQRRR